MCSQRENSERTYGSVCVDGGGLLLTFVPAQRSRPLARFHQTFIRFLQREVATVYLWPLLSRCCLKRPWRPQTSMSNCFPEDQKIRCGLMTSHKCVYPSEACITPASSILLCFSFFKQTQSVKNVFSARCAETYLKDNVCIDWHSSALVKRNEMKYEMSKNTERKNNLLLRFCHVPIQQRQDVIENADESIMCKAVHSY